MIKAADLNTHTYVSYVTGTGGGATFINKRKEKQRKTKDSLGYTNTICPFNITGNVPLFSFNDLQDIGVLLNVCLD